MLQSDLIIIVTSVTKTPLLYPIFVITVHVDICERRKYEIVFLQKKCKRAAYDGPAISLLQILMIRQHLAVRYESQEQQYCIFPHIARILV